MSVLNEVLQWLALIIFVGVVGRNFVPMKELMLLNAKNIHEIIKVLDSITKPPTPENTNAKKEN